MFRDDHEAALARIEALEAELARERQDDVAEAVKVERLERQLAEAKAKLQQTEEELDQYRPKPRPRKPAVAAEPRPTTPRAFVAASEPVSMKKPVSGRGGAIAVAVLLVAIVVVGVVLMIQSGSLSR